MSGEIIKQRKKSIVPLLLSIIALASISVLIWFILENKKLEEEQIKKEIALESAYLQLDSISNELNQKILTISQLGGEIDTLLSVQRQLEQEKKDLLNREKRKDQQINDLSEKVFGYKELLVVKDAEIVRLKEVNEILRAENNELKVETQELSQSIREIEKQKSSLQDQIDLVAQLSISGMVVTAINERGKETTGEFRNRHIKQLRIDFTVNENKVAPIEGKELVLKIIGSDGQVVFDIARGSGSFLFQGREQFYTAKKDILYDRKSQKISVIYEKGSDYAAGSYTVEVYTQGYLMGKGSFVVKA